MKLTQTNVEHIVADVLRHGLSTAFVAKQFKISQRRVQQLVQYTKKNGQVPVLRKPGRRPYAQYPQDIRKVVVRTAKRLKCGAVQVGKYLRNKLGIKIGNNKIQEILKEENMAKEEANKRVRKRPWVRYERTHSLSAVHIDWYFNSRRQWVCIFEDDASRMILAIGEYESRSSEAAIELSEEIIAKYGHIRMPAAYITDRGSEFYGVRRDKDGNSEHAFEKYCKERGIQLIYCRYAHPQTNGKVERLFREYERHRWEFETLEEFVYWYNCVRPHLSLDIDNLETPQKAFYRKLTDIIVGNYMRMVEQILGESQEVNK